MSNRIVRRWSVTIRAAGREETIVVTSRTLATVPGKALHAFYKQAHSTTAYRPGSYPLEITLKLLGAANDKERWMSPRTALYMREVIYGGHGQPARRLPGLPQSGAAPRPGD